MAMMGLPKSLPRIPVARQSEREAAANGPLVVVSDLNGFMIQASKVRNEGKLMTTMRNPNIHCG